MNTIDINDHLDRARIKKLLTIGLFASVITAIGDFLLGYAESLPASTLAAGVVASAPNCSDSQLFIGALLGMFGIFLEGLSFFAVYRLMADCAPKYAHIYRAGIFGYLWLAPIGCHLNVGLMNFAYKYLYQASPQLAQHIATPMLLYFGIPVYVLLIIFWPLMIVVQFLVFKKGYTPYPAYARWFNLLVGMIPALILAFLFRNDGALSAAFGTMFLSFGNAFTFGGLLICLPDQSTFDAFKKTMHQDG